MSAPALGRAAPAAIALGATWLALAGGTALASIGVSMDVSTIDVGQGLHPGTSYELPAVVVSNPGTKQGDYEMAAGHIEGQKELWPEVGWFTFSPGSFSLEPGEEKEVDIALDVPRDAALGEYASLLKAQVMPEGTGGVAGAAAGAHLIFEVVEPPGGGPSLGQFVPWLALGALVVVLVGLARRFRFRMERRT